jgi:hypothetical protein
MQQPKATTGARGQNYFSLIYQPSSPAPAQLAKSSLDPRRSLSIRPFSHSGSNPKPARHFRALVLSSFRDQCRATVAAVVSNGSGAATAYLAPCPANLPKKKNPPFPTAAVRLFEQNEIFYLQPCQSLSTQPPPSRHKSRHSICYNILTTPHTASDRIHAASCPGRARRLITRRPHTPTTAPRTIHPVGQAPRA